MERQTAQKKRKGSSSGFVEPFRPKEIADYYFKDIFISISVSSEASMLDDTGDIDVERKRECKCGVMLTPTKSGYSNEMNHVRNKHPDFIEIMKQEGQQRSLNFVPTQDAKDIYLWMVLIILENREFSMVESPYMRSLANNRKQICTTTFMKYKYRVGLLVWKKIKDSLPDKFGIVFDGWSQGTVHYVAIFAEYPLIELGKSTKKSVLLAMQPLLNETNQGAVNYVEFFNSTLRCYWKSSENVLYIVGDNTNVNPRIAEIMRKPFLGCYAHKFNLAIKRWLQPHENLIGRMQTLMSKLKSNNNAGKLRSLQCELHPIIDCETRWTGTYRMLDRWESIKTFVTDVNFPNLYDYLLSPIEKDLVPEMLSKMKYFNDVMIALQGADLTVSEARLLFNDVIKDDTDMEHYLGEDARIVRCPQFESAIVKVLSNKELTMSADERNAIGHLLIKHSDDDSEAESEVLEPITHNRAAALLESARKKGKSEKYESEYINLEFISPTSCIVERFFSQAKLVLNDHRRHMNVDNFENTLFLKSNKDFWDVQEVCRAINMSLEEETSMKANLPEGI
jgi:hypothetical protein